MSITEKECKNFTKEDIEYLTKLRIIKKNLVHAHGFPKNIARIDILRTKKFFGRYGKVLRVFISSKFNPDNKKVFSVYVTYSNEIEAAFAILCVDSLLIQGKIIRAFFGTTKYCSHFLNNKKCENLDNCMFLHQLVDEKDIIIDENMTFNYDDHINLAKKIIHYSSPKIKREILNIKKPKKIIFPFFDFIYLSEEEKENYFTSGNISYAGGNSNTQKDSLINVFNESESKCKYINNYISNYQVNDIIINLNDCSNLNPITFEDNIIKNNDISNKKINEDMPNNSFDPTEFHKLIDDSMKHIFAVKSFFSNLKNYPSKKLEFEYFRKDFEKNGNDFYKFFDGCTDCLKGFI